MSEPLDTSNFCKCKYKLKIVHQNRMDREPMVLQELPKGLHTYISLPRYASMKSHVDNVLLQVFVIARRLHLLTWLSSCILVLSIMSYFGLLLVHIEEDCDEMLGYMLPVVCPAVCFWAHWMLHKYRRQRCSDELEAALKQLRGLLAWENQKFNGIKLLLKSNLKFKEPHPKELDAHIEVTLWLNARSRCLVEPSEVFGDVSLIPDDIRVSPIHMASGVSDNGFFDITDTEMQLEENQTVKI